MEFSFQQGFIFYVLLTRRKHSLAFLQCSRWFELMKNSRSWVHTGCQDVASPEKDVTCNLRSDNLTGSHHQTQLLADDGFRFRMLKHKGLSFLGSVSSGRSDHFKYLALAKFNWGYKRSLQVSAEDLREFWHENDSSLRVAVPSPPLRWNGSFRFTLGEGKVRLHVR